jgi:quinol monooxygenase YgiN
VALAGDPLIYVDRSEVGEGKLDELRAAIAELADFVSANEPQLISYAAFIDPDGRHMTVTHIHRDPDSLDRHLAIAGPRFARFADLVRLLRVDLYGTPSEAAIAALRQKASLLGGATVEVHPLEAGFIR